MLNNGDHVRPHPVPAASLRPSASSSIRGQVRVQPMRPPIAIPCPCPARTCPPIRRFVYTSSSLQCFCTGTVLLLESSTLLPLGQAYTRSTCIAVRSFSFQYPPVACPLRKHPRLPSANPGPEELLVSARRSGQTSQLSTPTASCRVSRAPLASLALANYELLKGSLAVDLPVLKKERNPESIPVRTTGVDARCECKGRVKIVSASGILAHQRM